MTERSLRCRITLAAVMRRIGVEEQDQDRGRCAPATRLIGSQDMGGMAGTD